MANLYSVLLWRGGPTSASWGTGRSGTLPAGFVWDVRDIVLYNVSKQPFELRGVVIGDSHGAPIFAVGPGYALQGAYYHWEGRQILDATGDQLTLTTMDYGWYWRMSGYKLTSP